MRHFYTDEWQAPQPQKAGVAILETESALPEEPLAQLMAGLPHGSSARRRGYFHAREDASAEKQALGELIRKEVRGQLHIALLEQSAIEQVAMLFEGTRKSEVPYQAALWSAYLVATLNPGPAKFLIEHRKGFSQQRADEWLDKTRTVWRDLSQHLPMQGPMHDPSISVEVILKTTAPNAGLQMVDLLLWAYNRSSGADSELFHRIVPKPPIQFPSMAGTELRHFSLVPNP